MDMQLKNIFKLSGLLSACVLSMGAAPQSSAPFFNVNPSGANLVISTVAPNQTYPTAGISINTPGYTLAGEGTQCNPLANGYCTFYVSGSQPKTLAISGPNGYIDVTICLDGNGPNSCQTYKQLQIQQLPRFAYLTNSGSPSVYICTLDQTTGFISSCDDAGEESILGAGTEGIAISPAGDLAYITGEFGNSDVYQCSINPIDGTFNYCPKTAITSPTGYYAYYGEVALNTQGTYAYIQDSFPGIGPNYYGRVLACEIVSGIISATCVDTTATSVYEYSTGIVLDQPSTTAYIANGYSQTTVTVCSVDGPTFSNCVEKTGGGSVIFGRAYGVALAPSLSLVYITDPAPVSRTHL